MSIINIENLSFDAKVDSEAMNAITGGWGFSSIYKSCVRTVKISRSTVRQMYRAYRSVNRRTRSAIRTIRGWF